MAPFDSAHTTSYVSFVAATPLSCTVFEISPFAICMKQSFRSTMTVETVAHVINLSLTSYFVYYATSTFYNNYRLRKRLQYL